MSRGTAAIQKVLLEDMYCQTLKGTYAPYGELFCYVPRENLYKSLVMLLSDILPLETPKETLVALSLVRDL